ncbi:MAG: hypothetical protein U1E76_26465 [Planctomycetota bacterium]
MITLLWLLMALAGDDEPPGEVALDHGLQSLRAAETGEAVDSLERALWWDPDLTEAYEPLSIAYEKALKRDPALWYAQKHLEVLRSAEKPDMKAIGACLARIKALMGEAGAADVPATAVAGMLDLAKKYLAKKRWQPAAFWLAQVASIDPICKDVQPLQEQVVKNTTGGAALKLQRQLASRSPAWIARQDKAHRTWENCWSGKTRYYRLKTNIGYEVFQTLAFSLDQANVFYREVFGYKGPDPPVLTVQAFAAREDFNKQDSVTNPGVKGYYNTSNINTYDLRIDGFDLEDIYRTIFHEASHQFIDLITGTPPPIYLNEGISSYFEGARILPDGTVQTNEIPPHRIRPLAATLDSKEEITLEQLLRTAKPDYDGLHYCYGWGLMYFLLNWEDSRLGTPYKLPLMKLLEAYKKGGKHDIVKRFEDMVLKPVDGPKTVASLQPVWKSWMKDLIEEYRLGPAASSKWLERARKYFDAGRFDKAEAALRKVIAWLPDNAPAHELLARTYQQEKDEDRALYHVFMARDHVKGDAKLTESIEHLVQALDPIAADRVLFETRLCDAAVAESRALAAAEMPRTGLLTLAMVENSLGEHPTLAAAQADILAHGASLARRWSLFRGDSLPNWEAGPALVAEGTAMTFSSETSCKIVREKTSYAPPFKIYLEADPAQGDEVLFGLVYGWRAGEHAGFIAWNQKREMVVDGHVDFQVDRKTGRPEMVPAVDDSVKAKQPAGELVFEVNEQELVMSNGGKVIYRKPLLPGAALGKVGLVLQEGKVRITRIEMEQ